MNVTGGNVHAKGGENGAGIGGGKKGSGGSFTISKYILTAEGGSGAMAIGAGAGGSSSGDVTLENTGLIVKAGSSEKDAEDVTASFVENHTWKYVYIIARVSSWDMLQGVIDNSECSQEKPSVISLDEDCTALETDSALDIPAGKFIILDLNGHTLNRGLTAAQDNGCVIKNSGGLTVRDNSGAGRITGGFNTGAGGGIVSTGTLCLEDGTIEGNTSESGSDAVYNGGTLSFGDGTMVMAGTAVDGSDAKAVQASDAVNNISGYGYISVVRTGNFTALQLLIDAMENGDTLRLDANYTAEAGETSLVIAQDKNITIDLNGHTIDRGLTAADRPWAFRGLPKSVETCRMTGRPAIYSWNSPGKITPWSGSTVCFQMARPSGSAQLRKGLPTRREYSPGAAVSQPQIIPQALPLMRDIIKSLPGADAFNETTGLMISETDIVYAGRGETEYVQSGTAPEEAGTYTARLTLTGVKTEAGDGQSVTAAVDYEIARTDVPLSYNTTEVSKQVGDEPFVNALTNESAVTVSYSSGDETIAAVDADGQVTLMAAGTTTITASYAGDRNHDQAEASYVLTVAPAPTPTATPTPTIAPTATPTPTAAPTPILPVPVITEARSNPARYKGIRVEWEELSGVDGCQIRCSSKEDFSGADTASTSDTYIYRSGFTDEDYC